MEWDGGWNKMAPLYRCCFTEVAGHASRKLLPSRLEHDCSWSPVSKPPTGLPHAMNDAMADGVSAWSFQMRKENGHLSGNRKKRVPLKIWKIMLPSITMLRWIGRIRPTRIHPISSRHRSVSTGLHAIDTLWHACIDFATYSDDHPSRQSGLCPNRSQKKFQIGYTLAQVWIF